jgi:hypothetical protein
MTNLIKGAFAAQLILGVIAILHNWHIFRIESWTYLVYASILIGLYLTWQVIFNKELSKTTKVLALLIGTVPTFVMIGYWVVISSALH